MAATLHESPPRVVAGHLYSATIIDNATSTPCPWTLIRLAPWLDWHVVAGNQGMLLYLEELEEFADVVDQMAVNDPSPKGRDLSNQASS